jgi:hypothetical protein
MGIVNMTPQEYTPISTILGYSSLSSQALNFESFVVAIGEYYFDNRTRSIEKISTKSKIIEDMRSKLYVGMVVEWKVGIDPKENVVQATSSLNAFAGINVSSVLNVNVGVTSHIPRIYFS